MSRFPVSQTGWTLSRKAKIDQSRHLARVGELIKAGLPDLLREEEIIGSDGQKLLRIKLPGYQLPRFSFKKSRERIGQGQGKSKVGDKLGQEPASCHEEEGGYQPGIDFREDSYELTLTLEEIIPFLFEDFALPRLEEKEPALEIERIRLEAIRSHGLGKHLDKKRTALANIRRNALQGQGGSFHHLGQEDLRYKSWEVVVEKDSNAVVLAMINVSGSIDEPKRHIARAFLCWLVLFLRTKYRRVEIVFIAHDAVAEEVSEREFFTRSTDRVACVSRAYALALEIIAERFPPSAWNIYPFHFSDGDNRADDCVKAMVLVKELVAVSQLFGSAQFMKGTLTLLNWMGAGMTSEKFIHAVIVGKGDVYPALQRFLRLPA